MLSRLVIAALWSPAGKGLSFVMFILIVLIPDLCHLSTKRTKLNENNEIRIIVMFVHVISGCLQSLRGCVKEIWVNNIVLRNKLSTSNLKTHFIMKAKCFKVCITKRFCAIVRPRWLCLHLLACK